MAQNKIPWLNEGLVGFFEYDIVLYDHRLVGRSKEELQKEVSNLVMHQNYDRVSSIIKNDTPIEYWEKFTDEERQAIDLNELLESRLDSSSEYFQNLKQSMIESGELYPDSISIEELDYNYREYTDEEVEELRTFVSNFPNITQVELEDVYLRQNSENLPYLFQRSSEENSVLNAKNYESDLETSELICQLYEENEAIKSQLVENAELIVKLYEKVN